MNIDTDLRMASTGAIRKHLHDNPKNFDPRKYLAAATQGMKDICLARYESFGTAGNASKIKPINLEDMTQLYAKSELDPRVNQSHKGNAQKGGACTAYFFCCFSPRRKAR